MTDIVASAKARARETGEIIHGAFPEAQFSLDPLLNEGYCELASDQHRFEGRLRTYFKPVEGTERKMTILVCHLNIIRYFLCRQV